MNLMPAGRDMLQIDAECLRQLAPRQVGRRALRQDEIIEGMGAALAATLDRYEINTPLRVAHFLAQTAHESDGFCTTEEYASGQGYEGRQDLGNVSPGDGPLFKGRGLIQLTGRANYRIMGERLGLDLVGRPLSVNDPYVYLLVSCAFWRHRRINPHCDADDLISVTQLVNGGQNGAQSRKDYLVRAKALVAPVLARGAAPPGGGMPVLHRGSHGEAVASLQRALAELGYPLAIDGDFGPATEMAAKHFQAAAGLAPDGVAGAETWDGVRKALGSRGG